MEQKNPILNFRKKHLLNSENSNVKKSQSQQLEYSTMITKTRESIDTTEHS